MHLNCISYAHMLIYTRSYPIYIVLLYFLFSNFFFLANHSLITLIYLIQLSLLNYVKKDCKEKELSDIEKKDLREDVLI